MSRAVKAVGSGGTGYLSEGKGKGKDLPRRGHEGPEGKVPV
jgi:hypothetical protein